MSYMKELDIEQKNQEVAKDNICEGCGEMFADTEVNQYDTGNGDVVLCADCFEKLAY